MMDNEQPGQLNNAATKQPYMQLCFAFGAGVVANYAASQYGMNQHEADGAASIACFALVFFGNALFNRTENSFTDAFFNATCVSLAFSTGLTLGAFRP